MFKREHHIRIATILQSLDADLLLRHECFFGGGTAIALTHDEYRESVDIDFLVSDTTSYYTLRELLSQNQGINVITRPGMSLSLAREIRADRYGIRTMINSGGVDVKFEIVSEGRIQFEEAQKENTVCGVYTLSTVDLAASKLLANSDCWADDSVFSRDLIDLAMLELPSVTWNLALEKATAAYRKSITRDLAKAIEALKNRKQRLEECMDTLKIENVPRALLWQRIRNLEKK